MKTYGMVVWLALACCCGSSFACKHTSACSGQCKSQGTCAYCSIPAGKIKGTCTCVPCS